MLKPTLTSIFVLLGALLFAQSSLFTGIETSNQFYPQLERQFIQHEVYQIDADLLDELMLENRATTEISLRLGNTRQWDMILVPNELRTENYTLSIQTANGIITQARGKTITYKGHLAKKPESEVRMTIDKDLIYGLIETADELFFIEPLRYLVPDAPMDQFVVYEAKNVIPNPDQKCGYDEYKAHLNLDEVDEEEAYVAGDQNRMACKGVELAIALDWSMNVKHGGVAGAEGHASGVMNNVQSNYDNEFNDELIFQIVEIFVSACATCDPWNPTTNAGLVLDSFRAWANGGGFQNVGSAFDIGQFWTNRNFDGSTIGVAWVDAVCGSRRYHVLQDFSVNASALRVLTAHELGHNFGSGHDSNNQCIMSSTVNTSSCWSTQSLNAINSSIPSFTCLGPCIVNNPPIAGFTYIPSGECAPVGVQFIDQSQGNPDSWSWSFPGGSPSTSSLQNPDVIYNVPGFYDVTLVVANAGGTDILTLNSIVEVKGAPQPLFSSSTVHRTTNFFNATPSADSYIWDFGDGNISTATNPEHTYFNDGIYIVSLTANNNCGSVTTQDIIYISTPPTASFRASQRSGCDELEVAFTNFSSNNSVDFEWTFDGGTPSSSNELHPVVNYNTPGIYDVTLRVSNDAGSDVFTEVSYISIEQTPVAAFDYSVNNLTINFSDLSQNANQVSWDFGDGTTSNMRNPVHQFNTEDVFTVTMTVTNDCGVDVLTEEVTTRPTISFAQAQGSVMEDGTSGTVDCRSYVEFDVELSTSRAISGGDAVIQILANGTALDPADYDIINGSLTFPDNTSSTQTMTVRIYDDSAIESVEDIELAFTLSGSSNAYPGRQNTYGLDIIDNDQEVEFEEAFESNTRPSGWIKQQGFGAAGWRFENAASLSNTTTTVPGDAEANIAGTYDLSNLKTETFDLTQKVAAKITFDAYFPGLNSTAKVKVDAPGNANYELMNISAMAGQWQRGIELDLSKFIGSNNVRIVFDYAVSSQPSGGYFIDNVILHSVNGNPEIADAIHFGTDQYLGPFSTVYYHDDATGKLLAKIENLSDFDYGCTSVVIDHAGDGAMPFMAVEPDLFITEKNIKVIPDNNSTSGDYIITMYFTEDEVEGWELATGNDRQDLLLLRSPGSIQNITPSTPNANGGTNQQGLSRVNGYYYDVHWYVSSEFRNGLSIESGFAAASGISSAPLPVELLYFDGKAIGTGRNLLEWATANEERSSHFLLERSANGRDFNAIARVEAAGFSAAQQQYAYLDKEAKPGINYYRLKQVDTDQRFEFSEIISIEYRNDITDVKIFPNPSNGLIQLQLSNFNESLNLKIYSASGQLMMEQSIESTSSFTEQELDLTGLAKGLYFLEIESATQVVAHERIVKQ